jgi:hypothetical protein
VPEPADTAKAPVANHHVSLIQSAQGVDQQPKEGGLPQVLRAQDLGCREGRRLHGNCPRADDDRRHEHAQTMMPVRLIKGQQCTLPVGADHAQQLSSE